MKGIAILCVILGHIPNAPESKLIYSFHMPLFFIVAGYFFKPDNKYKARFIKDTKRLLLPYYAVIFALTFYTVIVHTVINSDYGQIESFLSLYVYSGTPAWFLVGLFWCRTFSNIIYTNIHTLYAELLLLIIAICAYLFHERTHIYLPFAILQGLFGMMFYSVGHMIKKYVKHINLLICVPTIVVWLGCYRYCNLDISFLTVSNFPLMYIVAISGTLSIYFISMAISKINTPILNLISKYLAWCGVVSLVILCAHSIERYIPIWNILGIDRYGHLVLFLAKVIFCTLFAIACSNIKTTRQLFGIKPVRYK